jgi:uncharacterized membrane protein YphA (DoxX/SURF4 family)
VSVNIIQNWRQTIDNGYLALALRLIVGGILICSGISKLLGHQQFVDAMSNYPGLPPAVIALSAIFLPWLELLVGVCLLLGLFLRWTALGTALLNLCFIAVNAIALYYGLTSCPSCFGATARLHSSQALGIDIFLLLTAVYLFLKSRQFLSLDGYLARRQPEHKIQNV